MRLGQTGEADFTCQVQDLQRSLVGSVVMKEKVPFGVRACFSFKKEKKVSLSIVRNMLSYPNLLYSCP